MTDATNGRSKDSSNEPADSRHTGETLTASVFEPDYDKNDTPYPGLFITMPIDGHDGHRAKRTYVDYYPDSIHGYGDPYGRRALMWGNRYYDEGMGRALDDFDRGECFAAAELLYLHAAYRGNPYGHLCLGYIYAYDRCNGRYLRTWCTLDGTNDDIYDPSDSQKRRFPIGEQACECFRKAAEAGIAEGCYKYGDMLRGGVGCRPDAPAAYREYRRSFELGRHEPPVTWGSAALRLAVCHEEGFGCEQDFKQALDWYRRATTGLTTAVSDGESWYQDRLAQAKSGVDRMRQEISGEY